MAQDMIPVLERKHLNENCLSTGQFAKRLGVHPNTVRYWRKQGMLTPVAQTLGGHFFYDESQVRDYFAGKMLSSRKSRSTNHTTV